jgi:uncharacterized protein YcbX
MSDMQIAGTVRRIARYPVKSMRGEPLSSVDLTLQGFAHDRRYAFVQSGSRSEFPWLTAREMPDMLRYRAAVSADGSVTVTAPSAEQWPVASEELRKHLEAQSGRPVYLLRDHRGSYDIAQVSIISRQTVARIAQESGTPEEGWRFRPNLLIDLASGQPFEELDWVGRTVRIGAEARVAITEVDLRCVMITLDPDTAEPSPSVLKCVVQQHGKQAGIYGSVLTAGEVRDGDTISLES